MKYQGSYIVGLFLLIFVFSCSKEKTNEIPNTNNYKLKLTGQIKACNGVNMSDGYLIIASNQGVSSIYITNGTFDTTFEASNAFDTIMVWAIDLNSLKTSDTLIRAVNADSIDLGQINACAWDVDEYINCKIDNEKYIYVPVLYDSLIVSAWDTLNAPTTYFYRSDNNSLLYNTKYYRTQFAGMTTGTFGVNWNSTIHIGRYYSFNMPSSGSITYNFYGNKGDYIIGTFNVPFIDNTDSLNHLLTANFKVRRDN